MMSFCLGQMALAEPACALCVGLHWCNPDDVVAGEAAQAARAGMLQQSCKNFKAGSPQSELHVSELD